MKIKCQHGNFIHELTGICKDCRIEELQAQLAANTILYKNLVKRYGELEAQIKMMKWPSESLAKAEAERDDAVYCHKTSDENRSILQQQLDKVREVLDKNAFISYRGPHKLVYVADVQAALKGDT